MSLLFGRFVRVEERSIAATIDYIAATGDPLVDGLLYGTAWRLGADRVLTYSFATAASAWDGYAAGSEPDSGFVAFGEEARAATRWALAQWGAVADIQFVEVDEAADEVGTLRLGFTAQESSLGVLGYSYAPSTTAQGGDVWLNANLIDDVYDDFSPGSLAAFALLHELGHALGLKHPHAGSALNGTVLDKASDSLLNSAMSYYAWPDIALTKSNTDRFPDSPMAFDIDALQAMYGAGNDARTGDDSYVYEETRRYFSTLYDCGGSDSIIVSGERDAKIDLHPGAWSQIGVPMKIDGGSIENPATIRIHASSLIENARGDTGNDTLTGNDSANELHGEAGRDVLLGETGDDLLAGGAGRDTLTGGAGDDRFLLTHVGRGEIDRITDFSGSDTLLFDTSVFVALTDATADNFVRGRARDADDFLIYRAGGRALYYDADGNGAAHGLVRIVSIHGPAARHLDFDDMGFL